MTIYDVDMPFKTAKTAVAYHFRKNGHVQDSRFVVVIFMFALIIVASSVELFATTESLVCSLLRDTWNLRRL